MSPGSKHVLSEFRDMVLPVKEILLIVCINGTSCPKWGKFYIVLVPLNVYMIGVDIVKYGSFYLH